MRGTSVRQEGTASLTRIAVSARHRPARGHVALAAALVVTVCIQATRAETLRTCLAGSMLKGGSASSSEAAGGAADAVGAGMAAVDMGTDSAGDAGAETESRRGGADMGQRRAKKIAQAFKLPELIIKWDSWSTSQMTTAIAAILLSERLGFTVKLDSGTTSKEMYSKLADGTLHLAFEAWPMSNAQEFREYVTTGDASSIEHFPYTTLFGRSGIHEVCSRVPGNMEPGESRCACAGNPTEPMLRSLLAACVLPCFQLWQAGGMQARVAWGADMDVSCFCAQGSAGDSRRSGRLRERGAKELANETRRRIHSKTVQNPKLHGEGSAHCGKGL